MVTELPFTAHLLVNRRFMMSNRLMTGFWRFILKIPPSMWEKQIFKEKRQIERETTFMSEEHRLVHHCVVRELPRFGKALPPEAIAERADMPVDRVTDILDELERHMTFLVTNSDGAVIWAYPVTVEKTPHRVTFSSGEQLYAA
jgi:hypothetical protein